MFRLRRCWTRSPTTLDLRKPFDKARATRVASAMKSTGVSLSDIGYFDNMLHDDAAIRKKKADFMIRAMDAAVLLGTDAVCGFVGRNQEHSMDQNLDDFVEAFMSRCSRARQGPRTRLSRRAVPDAGLDREGQLAQQHRLHARRLDRATSHREKHGVGDQFRIHYDPSHAILMGQGYALDLPVPQGRRATVSSFIAGFHVKGQVINSKGIAEWGYGGQTMERGDWKNGKPSANAADWGKRLEETGRVQRARTARHCPPRSAGVSAEPHRRLARSPARRARTAAARSRQDASGGRA